MTRSRRRDLARAWAVLAMITVAVPAVSVGTLRAGGRPLIDRRSCLAEPSSHTIALDRSPRGDVLYRFVYATLFGLGGRSARAGFPHVEIAPACTIGWKDPVAAVKIGPRVFVITFEGARIVSVRPSGVTRAPPSAPIAARA